MKVLKLTILFLLFNCSGFASDLLVMMSGEKIFCNIKSIGETEIVINREKEEITLPLALVKRVVFENSKTYYIGGGLRRNKRPFGLGINSFGPTIAFGSIYSNYYINQNFKIEFGTDINSVYGGFNFFPLLKNRDRMFIPYTGFFIRYTNDEGFEIVDSNPGFGGYLPVGIQLFLNNGIVFCLEIAQTTSNNYEIGPIWGGIKIGYQFARN